MLKWCELCCGRQSWYFLCDKMVDWANKACSPLDLSKFTNVMQACSQVRSQKFAMGRLVLGSGGGAPSRRRPMGVWGRSLQLPEAGGLGAKPPAFENFAFFLQKYLNFRAILIKIMFLKRSIKIGSVT